MTIEIDKIINAECLEHLRTMPDECLDCVVTSPPYYGLRDYGCDGQVGLEDTPEAYVQRLVDIFHEVKRCLKPEGTLWLNLGDSYATVTTAGRQQSKNPGVGANNPNAQNSVPRVGTPQGCKTKDLIGIPWMVAFALRADGWYLRQDIIWAKPNPMPEPIKDRCTKSHEYIFLLSKSPKYYFDYEKLQEPALYAGDNRGSRKDSRRGKGMNSVSGKTGEFRNKRDVWNLTPKPSKEEHYAMYPEELVKYCIEAGCPEGGVVFDPFMGSGTTAAVAKKFDRHYYGTELNPKFYEIAARRLSQIMSFI